MLIGGQYISLLLSELMGLTITLPYSNYQHFKDISLIPRLRNLLSYLKDFSLINLFSHVSLLVFFNFAVFFA